MLCDEQEWPQERPEWSEFGLKPSSEDNHDKMEVQEDVEVRRRQYDPQVSEILLSWGMRASRVGG